MNSTISQEWPEPTTVFAEIRAVLYCMMGFTSTWLLYPAMVGAVKKKFGLPEFCCFPFPTPSLIVAILFVSVPVVWLLSPVFFFITMFTGIRVAGITLWPQLLSNTCTSTQDFGLSETWPCDEDALITAWNAGKLGDVVTNFWVWYPAAVIAWGVAFAWILASPPTKKEELWCLRCRGSDASWQTEEKAGVTEQDSLV